MNVVLKLSGGLLVAVLAVVIVGSFGTPVKRAVATVGQACAVAPKKVDRTPIVDRHFAAARSESERLLKAHLDQVEAYFVERKSRTKVFAETALSLGSKAKLAWTYLPWTDKQNHERFVRTQFATQIFSNGDIKQLIASVVQSHVKALDLMEWEMLVKLRADLEDLPAVQLEQLHETIETWVDQDKENIERRVGDTVLREIWAEIGVSLLGDVAGMALTEALTSAGILAVGGASAIETLGIGLACAIVADVAYTAVTDPVGKLTKSLDKKMDDISQKIVNGDGKSPGLKAALERMTQERESTRREAILKIVDAQ